MRVVTLLLPAARLALVHNRFELLTGGPDVAEPIRNERIARLRDPDKTSDVALRLEAAYLVKLKAELSVGSNPFVCTNIAGRAEDPVRRVFAQVTDNPDLDGTTYDLYDKTTTRRFAAIPVSVEAEAPTRRRAKKETSNV